MKKRHRTPKNYDGSALTTHHIGDVLSTVLGGIGERHKERPDLILAAWPEVIGPKLSAMTQAISFQDGVLMVKVKNSTLHSLLCHSDKPKILHHLRQKFPGTNIVNIVFHIG